MSTFDGFVAEFPNIRIDYFRKCKGPPALAYFLSHVHSDHLAGLESFRSPFIYCSAATKAMLLNLERGFCRINYLNGILEARQQTYKHLSKLLTPLPLEAPTRIELQPGVEIRVTLFDANHCPGAVMFLIEGQGKAILYTGDMRSEPWLVNSIVRNPLLVGYTSGLKTLDKIYLDTSITQDYKFQSKNEGIAELLHKVASYPSDTVFHFSAWTYGYEEALIALAHALKTQIHVDDYKMRVYSSLLVADKSGAIFHRSREAAALVGYMNGNHHHPGCLTVDTNMRLHICEKASMCDVAKGRNVVYIQPVLAHLRDGDLAEGPMADEVEGEAELAPDYLEELVEKLYERTDNDRQTAEANDPSTVEAEDTFAKAGTATLAGCFGLIKKSSESKRPVIKAQSKRSITFPYSRHSSYAELCSFVNVFRPRDVWPCTVDREWEQEGITIQGLFGQYCSGSQYDYDLSCKAKLSKRVSPKGNALLMLDFTTSQSSSRANHAELVDGTKISQDCPPHLRSGNKPVLGEPWARVSAFPTNTGEPVCAPKGLQSHSHLDGVDYQAFDDLTSSLSENDSAERHDAYAMIREEGCGDLGLISIGCHTAQDREL